MKKFAIFPRFLVISTVLVLCFCISPEQSLALADGVTEVNDTTSSLPPETARDVVIPIGPVTELPGSTLVRVLNPPDPSSIGKAAALELIISGIQLDKYTSVWWGPQDLTAVKHSLAGGMAPERVLTFDAAGFVPGGGSAYFLGSSPSVYAAGTVDTRFRLLTLSPMFLASSVNISDASVVLPITGGGLSAQLQFQTKFDGVNYVPSLDYFNSYAFKSSSLSGSVLSSFTDAFWYTAPDVEVTMQSLDNVYCLGSNIRITVNVENKGPGIASQIMVSDTWSTNWEYVSYESSPCGLTECYDPLTGVWTVGNLNEGQGSYLTLNIKIVAPGLGSLTETKTQYQVDSLTENDTETMEINTQSCSYLPLITR